MVRKTVGSRRSRQEASVGGRRVQRGADQRRARAVAHATNAAAAVAVDASKVATVRGRLGTQAGELGIGRLRGSRVGEASDGAQHGARLSCGRGRTAVVSVVSSVLLVAVVGSLVGRESLAVPCPEAFTVIDGASVALLPAVAGHLQRHGRTRRKDLGTESWAGEARLSARCASEHAVASARGGDVAVTAVGRHGTRDGERWIGGLGSGGGSALVWTTLDATTSLLTSTVLARVNETVLNATAAGSALVALLACLLAVDTGVLDLLALGSDAGALKRGVAVLMRQEIRVVALELAVGHHVGVAHLMRGVQLTVGVHLWR